MFRPNHVKALLKDGRTVYATRLVSADPNVAEALSFLGFDGFVVDFRTPSVTLHGFVQTARATQSANATCFALAPANDPVFVKRALDVGAEGIIIPDVGSAEQAALAVKACRFRPQGGVRGIGYPMARSANWSTSEDEYPFIFLDQLLLGCLLSEPGGLAQADAIAAIDGVDLVFIPQDADRDRRRAAERAVLDQGATLGGMFDSPSDAAAARARGYRFICIGSDEQFIASGAAAMCVQLASAIDGGKENS